MKASKNPTELLKAKGAGAGKTTLPFTKEQVRGLVEKYPTPFYIYHEKGIRESAKLLKREFSWVPNNGFTNFFAVKACPNLYILELLKNEGFGADCSSLAELRMASIVGIRGENIMFTSNDTPAEEFRYARNLGAIINLDDVTYLDFVEKYAGLPDLICFRYNPGVSRKGNLIIGKPEEAKFGITEGQLYEAYSKAISKNIRRFGIHTMMASNELAPSYFIDNASMLVEVAARLSAMLSIKVEFINIGGGIGIPYRPEEREVDLGLVSEGIRNVYSELVNIIASTPRLFMECGRLITGPHGYLVSTVRHVVRKYRNYVGLDACMTHLSRPALYSHMGAYHHITVMGKEDAPKDCRYDVTGSVCDNSDKFAIDRELPKIDRGDIFVFHDAGAHSYSMGAQYNGKLRCAEFLLTEDGGFKMIRRAESVSDYLSTFDFEGSRFSSGPEFDYGEGVIPEK